MSFQAVSQAEGPISILCTVTEVGPAKLGANQKQYQAAKLRDSTGEVRSVTIFKGNGELLTATNLGQRLAFNLSTYQGRNGLAYSGFWNSRAKVAQQTQQAPQQPKSQSNGSDMVRNRGIALSYVLQFLKDECGTATERYEKALEIADFMATGKIPRVEEYDEPEEPPF